MAAGGDKDVGVRVGDQVVVYHLGEHPDGRDSGGVWYGVTPQGSSQAMGMSLVDADAFVRQQVNVAGQFGMVGVDGLMTGMCLMGSFAAGHVVEAIAGEAPEVGSAGEDEYFNFSGVVCARWLEILTGLRRSPRPVVGESRIAFFRAVESCPDAYQPIVGLGDDHAFAATEWAGGFIQVVINYGELWAPLMSDRCEALLGIRVLEALHRQPRLTHMDRKMLAANAEWISPDVIKAYDFFQRRQDGGGTTH